VGGRHDRSTPGIGGPVERARRETEAAAGADYDEVPGAPGAALVASVWSRQGRGEGYVVLPDGQTDLLFRRVGGTWRGFVVGPMSTALVTPATFEPVVGLRLALGTARALVGVRLDELAGAVVPLGDLGLGRLLDPARLEAACAGRAGLRDLGAAVTERAPAPAPGDRRVRAALQSLRQGATSMGALARDLGVSERHLSRLFREEVGVSPKRLASLVRLRAAMAVRLRSGASWAWVAALAGYADESHLAREARRLTGVRPSALERAMSDSFSAGHVRAAMLRA
jgi:AraC-like DNA-binding protein